MDREEFERIKQAEREHLRKIKALKQQLRDARRTASTLQALNRIRGAADTPELDASLEEVQRKAIESEVRLDMALEAAAERQQEGPGAAGTLPPALDEEEARAMRAAALVAQMKAALDPAGALDEEAADAAPTETPEKTIGRTARAEDGGREAGTPPALPEKTIGRAGGPRRQAD